LTGIRTREDIHKEKLDRVAEIWEENNRKPMLVAFNYRGERELLVNRFGCPFIDGSSSESEADRLIDAWNAGSLPMLAIQPLSVGFGLNLQSGGRHLLWFGLPDSGEVYVQTVARLHRQGQSGAVFVYRLICNDTIERAIAGLLRRKLLSQSNLLAAMKEVRDNYVGR
jgi:SNF2 family DNA or RNA helicase